jgi:hypothetical protein
MLQSFFEGLFGCAHKRTTFPLTPAHKSGNKNATYVVCLDCGKEFAYDWSRMRVGEAVGARVPAAEVQPQFR